MTANTSSEVEISCNIGGAFRDNYVDFGADSEESEEEKTLEMGTSYDPPEPEQNENRAPNANNMLKILEQEMMKGFGGGIPAFMQNEVHRMNKAAKSQKVEQEPKVVEVEESKQKSDTFN